MSDAIYGESHVVLSRLIDRRYNNPLGEAVFPLLQRLVGRANPAVLDVGCGRGRIAVWWAHRGARVTAFDPSPSMLDEARRVLREEGAADRVELFCTDLEGFETEARFDLAIAHDVLCYSPDRVAGLARMAALTAPQGVVSVSDYFGDPGDPTVQGIVTAWGIEPPVPFEDYERSLSGYDVLVFADTTRRYLTHWADMRARIAAREKLLTEQLGTEAVGQGLAQIDAIERAVAGGRFGHLWTVLGASG